MSWTYQDLLAALRQLDEIELIEILRISPEDIVDRFQDVIEDRVDELFAKLEEYSED